MLFRSAKKRAEQLEAELKAQEEAAEKLKTLLEEETQREEDLAKKESEGVDEDALIEEMANDKKEQNDPYKGGFLKHKPAYHEGMLWLAKTYIERQNYLSAEYYLNKLEDEEPITKALWRDVIVTRADLAIKKQNDPEAISYLTTAIEELKKRKEKARYAYILAQLYQRRGNAQLASTAFQLVKKYNAPYEMRLNAQLSQVRNDWVSGITGTDESLRRVGKFEKDDKNSEYLGDILMTKAEILLADRQISEAMAIFNQALEKSPSSSTQLEVHYRMAVLYYSMEEYIDSKEHYDKALELASQNDSRYLELRQRSRNLSEIARNTLIIDAQDSIMKIAQYSDDELVAFTEKRLAAKKEEDEKDETAEELQSSPVSLNAGTSSFFAYNEKTKRLGRQEFFKIWGNRRLTDNWRTVSEISEVEEESQAQVDIAYEELQKEVQKELERIKLTIPNTPEKLEEAQKIREKAYYELGSAYRVNLDAFKKSNETLEYLLANYPNTKYELDALYHLYLNSEDLNDQMAMDHYRQIILSKYGESDFAEVLRNPNAAEALFSTEKKIDETYEEVYSLFKSGQIETAKKLLANAKVQYGNDHDFVAKYDLLEAHIIGKLDGKKAYVDALRKVKNKYQDTPEEIHASEMLRFLLGDQQAFDGKPTAEDINKFTFDNEKLHYGVIVFYDVEGNELGEAKKEISDFNNRYHRGLRLRATSIVFNAEEKSQIVLIRRFLSLENAMNYYRSSQEKKDQFLSTEKYSYEIYPINQKNYRTIMKDRSINGYRLFFEENYLKEDKEVQDK